MLAKKLGAMFMKSTRNTTWRAKCLCMCVDGGGGGCLKLFKIAQRHLWTTPKWWFYYKNSFNKIYFFFFLRHFFLLLQSSFRSYYADTATASSLVFQQGKSISLNLTEILRPGQILQTWRKFYKLGQILQSWDKFFKFGAKLYEII